MPVKKTRFFCNGMSRFRIEIIVALVVTKSSNTIMLLSFGGFIVEIVSEIAHHLFKIVALLGDMPGDP